MTQYQSFLWISIILSPFKATLNTFVEKVLKPKLIFSTFAT